MQWDSLIPIGLKYVSHCFEEHISGQQRRIDVQFDICVDPPPRDHLGKRSNERCTNRFTQSLLGLAQQLERVSFPTAGSLHLDDRGGICVGPLITCQSTDNTDRPYLGPFSNAQKMYLATLDYAIASIVQGRGAWSPDTAVLAYLAYRMARRLVEQCQEMKRGPFFVCHGEPKGDHLLFDNDYGLTGVIDWEWYAVTVLITLVITEDTGPISAPRLRRCSHQCICGTECSESRARMRPPLGKGNWQTPICWRGGRTFAT